MLTFRKPEMRPLQTLVSSYSNALSNTILLENIDTVIASLQALLLDTDLTPDQLQKINALEQKLEATRTHKLTPHTQPQEDQTTLEAHTTPNEEETPMDTTEAMQNTPTQDNTPAQERTPSPKSKLPPGPKATINTRTKNFYEENPTLTATKNTTTDPNNVTIQTRT